MLSAAVPSQKEMHPTSLHNEFLKKQEVSTRLEGLCGHVEEPQRMRAPWPLGHWEERCGKHMRNERDLPASWASRWRD